MRGDVSSATGRQPSGATYSSHDALLGGRFMTQLRGRRPAWTAVAGIAVLLGLTAAAPAPASGLRPCAAATFPPDVRVGVAVAPRGPSCAVAQAAARDAIAARFNWAVVSEGRWWAQGDSAGDDASWSTRYHHYEVTDRATALWTIRLRVVWRGSAPAPHPVTPAR